jgi:hypothetical protein
MESKLKSSDLRGKKVTVLGGEAEDIAQAFVYLMKQPYTTGQSLVTDGGAVLV